MNTFCAGHEWAGVSRWAAARAGSAAASTLPLEEVESTPAELCHGEGTTSSSGVITIRTANSGAAGVSGMLIFSFGMAKGGNSGSILVGTGAATAGRGGLVSITVGSGTSGVGGHQHCDGSICVSYWRGSGHCHRGGHVDVQRGYHHSHGELRRLWFKWQARLLVGHIQRRQHGSAVHRIWCRDGWSRRRGFDDGGYWYLRRWRPNGAVGG